MAGLKRIGDFQWRLDAHGGMRVPGIIYSDRSGLEKIQRDRSLEQVANVAHLPGIVSRSLAMPDIHWGYGFPIGGVAAMDMEKGVVSPGGVGGGGDLALGNREMAELLRKGARWVVGRGWGSEEDLERTEEEGVLRSADPDAISPRAMERGKRQVGTLGSGNHFVEVGFVESIFDEEAAGLFGLREGAVTLMIHCGSRGLGHQVATDFLQVMQKDRGRDSVPVPDRQLACVPIRSSAGERYLAAMAAAANYAWANRQYLLHLSRQVFRTVLPGARLRLVYDVSHNIAKIETHRVKGRERELCVHRKGATRAFPAGHRDVPEPYRAVGQPVLIPGDMRSGSYVLVGTERAMDETFGSTCHGAGRVRSRSEAKRKIRVDDVERKMAAAGIALRARSRRCLVEEAPEAYKEIDRVVDVVHGAGISRKVARLKPLVVIKG